MKSKKMVEGGGEPHLRPQLLARDTRTSFLEHGYGDLRASKYFSGWDESRGVRRRDEVVVPSLFFPSSLFWRVANSLVPLVARK